MANTNSLILLICLSSIVVISADWNIMSLQNAKQNGLEITLKNYCESWRLNVELNNIRDFEVVPEECIDYLKKYATSSQYDIDSERTVDECTVFISTSCTLRLDGRDAWIFDIDDTLLSTVPYYKKHHFGGEKLNLTSFEEWIRKGSAPALTSSLKLFNYLKARGVQIILLSSRREYVRSATIDNLVDVGYHGWTSLILRGPDDEGKTVQLYKREARKQLVESGYRILGILGDQWSSIKGLPSAKRTFKLPNSVYYVA
ncbi:acid phosphatase 1-like [Impatiens glandulifera]|uniref:acid phosphatase 1-like n=1 Tax=Impatiens glandulifera TaxID=253017 RepID=UPI001FB07BE4|nr:acid phosphatase 1-like [Impatiens glandulifera]